MSTKRMANRQLPTPMQNMISFVTKRTRHAQQPKKPKRTAEDYRVIDTNDAKEVFKYLDATLADEFKLRRTMKAKPVLGADDILLLLTHL
ncbi:hypothetical protein V500_04790 [Pseudogymnoascus sp. VKM F-4518 (FW-2643)]|nr:hypothetical protein V500_04790 [Pseudogymnoascus sp. VKM F-4518 (FW-2643)]